MPIISDVTDDDPTISVSDEDDNSSNELFPPTIPISIILEDGTHVNLMLQKNQDLDMNTVAIHVEDDEELEEEIQKKKCNKVNANLVLIISNDFCNKESLQQPYFMKSC